MAGYIGSKIAVTQVDGYNRTEADAEFVNDPNDVITVSGSNVGIGTASPVDTFHAVGSDGATSRTTYQGATEFIFENNGDFSIDLSTGNANQAFINWHDTDAVQQGWLSYNHNGDYMRFGVNAAERMRIDSAGRVTKPYQPTGFWYLTGTQTIPSGSTEVVELNATGYSQGLSLNTSNRTITVPVAGKYLVCGAVTFLYGEAVHCGIQVNGGVSASAGVPNEWLQNGDYGTQAGDQESMQNVKILNLSANDTIRMRAYQQSGSTQQLQNNGRTFLSVTLLG